MRALVGLAVFAVTYLFLAGFRLPFLNLGRPGGALVGAAAMVALGVVAPSEIATAVDLDTLVLLLGMMVLAAYLTRAAFFRACAWYTLRLTRTPRGLLVGLVFVSAALSAVMVNDTICLMLTPIVLMLAETAELEPTPYLLALCMASNTGSVATFTGNPQNMLIGVASHLPYATFVAYMIVPAALSTLCVLVVLLVAFRKQLARRDIHPGGTPPPVNRKILVIAATTLAGVVAAFFAGFPLAWSALAGAGVVVLLAGIDPRPQLEKVDYLLLLFFACLFVVVHGVNQEGWASRMHDLFAPLMTGSPLRATFGFTGLTVVASNLFSNVPFVMLARVWVPGMRDPTLGWQVLALASTLAGNLTLVGSVANLIVFEGARGRTPLTFWSYLRVGVPTTLLSLVVGLGALLLEHALFG